MNLTETIKGFAALGNDWDSYGAGPISPAVIACALETAAALHAGGWTVAGSRVGRGFSRVRPADHGDRGALGRG